MSNGFALVMRLLPSPVGPLPQQDTAAPSVQSHYRTFTPTMGCSAPVTSVAAAIEPRAVVRVWLSSPTITSWLLNKRERRVRKCGVLPWPSLVAGPRWSADHTTAALIL